MYVHGEDIAGQSADGCAGRYGCALGWIATVQGLRWNWPGNCNIPRDNDGWFRELNYNAEPNSTGREGIYLAGVCQGPKDIPDTVAQASAAAAYVLGSIVGAKSREATKVEEKAGTPARS